MEQIIFRETTTLGVRRWASQRHKLARHSETVQTPWGPVSGMRANFGGTSRFSPEFEACREIAKANGVSFRAVFDAAMAAAKTG
jgi:uncharacterized protein (DUF111 family)